MRDPHDNAEWREYSGQVMPPGCSFRTDLSTGRTLYRIKIPTAPVPAPPAPYRGIAWAVGIIAFVAIWWFVLETAN